MPASTQTKSRGSASHKSFVQGVSSFHAKLSIGESRGKSRAASSIAASSKVGGEDQSIEGLRSLSNDVDTRTLVRSTSGAVFVEYVVVLLMVTIIAAGAIVITGIPLLRLFRLTQAMLALPFP